MYKQHPQLFYLYFVCGGFITQSSVNFHLLWDIEALTHRILFL